MRYLISGAQGFIGRNVTAQLLRAPANSVLGIGRSAAIPGFFTHRITAGNRLVAAPLPTCLHIGNDRYSYKALAVEHKAGVAAAIHNYRPDRVIHLASELTGGDAASQVRTNILGTLSLLQALAESAVAKPRLVLASTGAVYGVPERLPITEDAETRPVDIYGTIKHASEEVARTMGRSAGIDVIIGRVFNVFGPGADERHAPARFAQQIAGMAHSGPAVMEVGDLTTTRDFIDVRDAARAVCLIAERGEAGEAYNIATGVETPLASLVELITMGAKVAPEIRRTHFRQTDVPRHVASVERLHRLGFVPGFSLKQSLDDMLAYYQTIEGSA